MVSLKEASESSTAYKQFVKEAYAAIFPDRKEEVDRQPITTRKGNHGLRSHR